MTIKLSSILKCECWIGVEFDNYCDPNSIQRCDISVSKILTPDEVSTIIKEFPTLKLIA